MNPWIPFGIAIAVAVALCVALLFDTSPRGRHMIADVETEVATVSRWVVAKRIGIVAAAVAVANVLVSLRLPYVTQDLADSTVTWLNRILDAFGVLAAIPFVQRATTPADPALHPVDVYGNALVSDLTAGPHPGIDTPVEAASAPAPADGTPSAEIATANPDPDPAAALAAAAAVHPMPAATP